jgi:hypothetical protein
MSNINPITQSLNIHVCDDAQEAITRGFNWLESQPPVKPVEVKRVVVVRKGTLAGNATVDFVPEDETGQQFVFMITGNLLKSIPC